MRFATLPSCLLSFTAVLDQVVVLQLRDLVPPSYCNNSQQDGLDNKRPKHVVLSDTIVLVKDLQDKVM